MEASSNTQVLFGTNINSNEVQNKLKNFIQSFTQIDEDNDRFDAFPHYIEMLKHINETEQYVLDVNCEHIYEFDQSLYRQIENYPTDIIPIFDLVVTGIFKEQFVNPDQNDDDTQNDPII